MRVIEYACIRACFSTVCESRSAHVYIEVHTVNVKNRNRKGAICLNSFFIMWGIKSVCPYSGCVCEWVRLKRIDTFPVFLSLFEFTSVFVAVKAQRALSVWLPM